MTAIFDNEYSMDLDGLVHGRRMKTGILYPLNLEPPRVSATGVSMPSDQVQRLPWLPKLGTCPTVSKNFHCNHPVSQVSCNLEW